MRLMKAAIVTGFAPIGKVSEYFKVADIPAPDPNKLTQKQIIVDVHASILTRDDLYVAQGSHAGGFEFLQRKPPPTINHPYVLGSEFSGRVAAVGPNVRKFKVGDYVCGMQDAINRKDNGPWAEQVLAGEDYIVKFDPTKVKTFVQAASLVLPAFIGSSMIKEAGIGQQRDLRCLVVGASGSVGSVLTQLLASDPRVQVTGVCGPRNVDRVQKLGAQDVFDYTKGSFHKQLEASGKPRFDVIMDLVGGEDVLQEGLKHLLKPSKESRYLSAVGPIAKIGSFKLSKWEQTKFGFHLFLWTPFHNARPNQPTYKLVLPERLSDALWKPLMDAKIHEVKIDRVVPFQEKALREGMKYLLSSTPKQGRVALAIARDAESEIEMK